MKLIWIFLLILFSCSSPVIKLNEFPPKPNIVLIVADDMGWTDVSTGKTNLGNPSDYYQTPNIDRLASLGKSFDNAYSCGPNCVPTRATLWSGQYTPKTGIYTVPPSNRGNSVFRKLDAAPTISEMQSSVVTIAESLTPQGYNSGYFGKWHLGNDPNRGPLPQGFSVNHGGNITGSLVSHFALSDGSFTSLPGLGPNGKPYQFMADRLTDEAISFIDNSTSAFFAAVMHYSPHSPIQAPVEDMTYFNDIPKGVRHKNQIYAAMLKNLDMNIGRIIFNLESTDDPRWPGHKLIENTVVIFISDNGGVGGYADAGVNGVVDYTHQYPLKGGKGMLYEGGIRVPMIIRWDGVISPNTVDSTPVITLDLYPTIAKIAGATLLEGLDGLDLRPLFSDNSLGRQELFWHFPCYLEADVVNGTWRTTPVSVIRKGNWKLFFFYENRKIELYHLGTDIGENTNIAGHNFALVSSMITSLKDWLVETGAKMPLEKGTTKEVPYPSVLTVKETPAIVK